MKNRKFVTVSLAAALAIGTITANGVLVSADAEKGTIKVAASATPHAEILEEAKPILEKEGWDLEVTVFDDYVQPNLVVESGDFDANYFQHIPYLDNFNEEQGTHLVNAGGIHYEPFGIYPGTKKTLDDLEDGDTIAVPNDTTNEARALLLLQDNGVITLKDGAGLEATVKDIEENPKNIQIEELEAAQVSRVKDEVAFVVLNGNYALQAGYSVSKDSIAHETSDSEAAKTYVNIIAVKEGNPVSIMTSYNLINGIHAANSKDLCMTVARKEWGFDGVIMSDWNTTVPEDGSIPWKCVTAGNDIIMPGNAADAENIRKAFEDGKLSEEVVRMCAGRILNLIHTLTAE